MTTALPEAHENRSPDEHMQISRRFIRHAREELARGERLQASEKIWGAASHALKAVGKERGWNTDGYRRIEAIAGHLGDEFGNPAISSGYGHFYGFHLNFYQNEIGDEGVIAATIDQVERFVNDLESIRGREPQPFTIKHQYQINRFPPMQAVPRQPRMGETYTGGFVNQSNLERYKRQWASRESGGGDDDRSPGADADGAGSGGR